MTDSLSDPHGSKAAQMVDGATTLCRWIRFVSITLALAMSVSNLLIWCIPALRFIADWPGVMIMRMNAAIGMSCAAVSLILWQMSPPPPRRMAFARAFAVVPLLIGALTTLEYLAGFNLKIDQLFAPATFDGDRGNRFVVAPGRMSLNAALPLFFLGMSLLLVDTPLEARRRKPLYLTPFCALLAALPAICGFVGYLLQEEGFTGILRSTNILLHSAISLFLLSTATLAARPNRAPVSNILSVGADGILLRWLLPGSTGLLFCMAWLIEKGRSLNVIDPGEGTALMLYGGMILLSVLIFAASRAVAREEQRAHRADDALREQERRSQAIVQTSLDAVFLIDGNGLLLDWNAAAENIFGWRRSDVLGKPLANLVLPERLRAAHMRGLQQLRKLGKGTVVGRPLELPALRKDGSEFPAELSINPLAGTTTPLFVGFVRDITERAAALAALREGEQRFRTLADNISQLAWMTDDTGSIVWYNRRWFEYTGTTIETMRGWGWMAVHHPDHVNRVVEKIRGCFQRGEAWEDLFPLRGVDGSYRWFLSRAMPIRDESGSVQRWFGTNTDVTEQRELAEALARAKLQAEEASSAKDHFFAALSHELRTPLTPVLLTSEALRDDARLPADAREDLAMIVRNVSLEGRLIDDLLDLTRIVRGKLPIRTERCNAHSLLHLAIDIVKDEAAAKNITVVRELTSPIADLVADSARLQQVFWNLLRNAIKFTPNDGRIVVRTTVSTDSSQLLIEISDTGIGFEPKIAETLFLPFEQGARDGDHRYGGLGLGLAIARAIVDIHGGSIRAQSKGPGTGATFAVSIPIPPLSPENLAEDSHHALNSQSRDFRSRILVVDDHDATLASVSRLLRKEGHEVLTANSVATAVALGEANEIDILISDIGLPDGTGCEIMKRLHLSRPALRGIALSGFGMESDIAESRAAGFSAHLVKPIDFNQLKRKLRELSQAAPHQPAPTTILPTNTPVG